MSGSRGDNAEIFEEYEITEKSETSLACEWDNYLNDGFDIFSVNNGLMTKDMVFDKNNIDNCIFYEEINVDNGMEFSFKNNIDTIEQQNEMIDKQEKEDSNNNNDNHDDNRYNYDTNKEKEDTTDNVNFNIFNGFSSPKKAYNNEKTENIINKEKDIITKENENISNPDPTTNINSQLNEVKFHKIEEEFIEAIENKDEDKDNNKLIRTGNMFDENNLLICNFMNIINIYSPKINYRNMECQTEAIKLKQTNHHFQITTFTATPIKKPLSYYSNETFTYNPIQNNSKIVNQKIITNEILLTIIPIISPDSKSIFKVQNCSCNQRYNANNIDIQYDNKANNHNYYIIQKVYWFSVIRDAYNDYLRKEYRNIDITKEISFYLKKEDNNPSIQSNSRSISLRLNSHEDITKTPCKIHDEKIESINSDINSIQQLNHFELAALNNNNSNININIKPLMVECKQSNHLSSLISEEAFHSVKAQTINLPFESIDHFNYSKTNNNDPSLYIDSSPNDSKMNKDIEIKKLHKKLNSFKYQNKLIIDENKKLLEVINIFKQLSTIEKEKGNDKEKSDKTLKDTIDINNNDQIIQSNNKIDLLVFDDMEKRLNQFTNNQFTIPLQIKLPNNYTTSQDSKHQSSDSNSYLHIKINKSEYNNKTPFTSTEGNKNMYRFSGINKQNDKRKKIVQQLESILDNVTNEKTKISQTDNSQINYPSHPLLITDLNKKTTESSNKNFINCNKSNTNHCNNKYNENNKICFHLISQRKLYENLIKSISNQKEQYKK